MSEKASPSRKERRGKNRKAADENDDVEVFERKYTRPKPTAITTNLFMWEHVAAFSPPEQVVEIERVCFDIADLLRQSNTGTRLMQRYWNAMSVRLTWEEGDARLSDAKRFLQNGAITRSEGKKQWKKIYGEQYAEWVETVKKFRGDLSRRPVERHAESLNEHKSSSQLKELSAEESYLKAIAQRRRDGDSAGNMSEKKMAKESKHLQQLTASLSNDARATYKLNPRDSDRHGKHKKGGTKKWADMAETD